MSKGVRVRVSLGVLRSSSPTAETTPSSSVKCQFESGDEYNKYICPGSSADRAPVYGAGLSKVRILLGAQRLHLTVKNHSEKFDNKTLSG